MSTVDKARSARKRLAIGSLLPVFAVVLAVPAAAAAAPVQASTVMHPTHIVPCPPSPQDCPHPM